MNSTLKPIVLRNLFSPDFDFDSLPWEAFREGVQMVRLYGEQTAGPSAALLKYEAGAGVPYHTHTGYEHILVLRSSQRDERGESSAGTLVINPPGSSHSVVTDNGGIVLVIWHSPVQFPEPAAVK